MRRLASGGRKRFLMGTSTSVVFGVISDLGLSGWKKKCAAGSRGFVSVVWCGTLPVVVLRLPGFSESIGVMVRSGSAGLFR